MKNSWKFAKSLTFYCALPPPLRNVELLEIWEVAHIPALPPPLRNEEFVEMCEVSHTPVVPTPLRNKEFLEISEVAATLSTVPYTPQK